MASADHCEPGREQTREPGREQQFVQLCLRSRWDVSLLQAARALTQQEFDWEALDRIALSGGLAPLLYSLVRGHNLLPPQLEQTLQSAYYDTARRNLSMLHRLGNVLRQLRATGVEVIVLKGAGLASAVYGNVAVRPMGDVDLLVRPAQASTALDVLGSLGYTQGDTEPHAGDALAYENEVMLRHPGGAGVTIEVHWNLIDSPHYQRAIRLDWFWETAQPVEIGQAAAWILGPEAQVIHLCAHLTLHHGSEGRLWLHDIAEVIALYQSQINWEQLLAQAQACDLVIPLQRILPRIADEWQAPIPALVLEQLRALRPSRAEARVFSLLTAKRRPVALRFWADLVSMPNWPHRLRYAWNNLLPSPTYMQRRYHISSPMLLLFYYPYRWCLGVRSALGMLTRTALGFAAASILVLRLWV